MGDLVLMKGNEAIAEAAIRSGCKHYFGYPITPQTEIAEYMAKVMPKAGGLCLQAESEIAAINMVLGASAAGARALTSSSSPGVSLKGEGISYIVGSDLPAVIVNVQRGGPGLGGIQPAQSDYYQATKALGHGDLRLIVLAPSSIQEIVELTALAFDLADQYRTPVMILADGALGQMMEPVDFSKLIPRELPPKDWACTGYENRGVTADKRNVVNSLYIEPDELERLVNERFNTRYAAIERDEVRYDEFAVDDADVVVVAYGITARIAKTAVDSLRAKGIKAGIFRPVTLVPFPKKRLNEIAKSAKGFLVAELNMGQMVDDVKIAVECSRSVGFFGRTGGMMPTPNELADAVADFAKEIL
ncbi:3-methyl-2-oxobutanoate dehydrogenase subunit VorB [Clostridia bacterium]|nr:3-methyl-2-oxobutanoate dehydrogenase subunit VorB [Clostridia bacterium]